MKLLHFADLHLGRQFSNLPEVQDILSNARYDTLDNLIKKAEELECDLITIGGDLFDRVTMTAADIQKTVNSLNAFENGPVLVLPGNHDFITPGSKLWDRFKKEAHEHVIVLDATRPYSLQDYDLPVMIYPGPCFSKHSGTNQVGWVQDIQKDPELLHMGIAHGSIEGVSPDFESRFFPMTQKELQSNGVDMWLMGHTHITWPEHPDKNDKIFNPGTPEPDEFGCKHNGRAFMLEVSKPKNITCNIIHTGQYRFDHKAVSLTSAADLDALVTSDAETCKHTAIKFAVSGRLDPEEYDTWKNKVLPDLRSRYLYAEIDDSSLTRKVTKDQIKKEFPKGSFSDMLLTRLLEEEDEEALQTAYYLIREAVHEA